MTSRSRLIYGLLYYFPICLGIYSQYRKTLVILEIKSCLKGFYYNFLYDVENSSPTKCGLDCLQNEDCRRFMFDRKTKICSLFESGENCLTDENIEDKICYRQLLVCNKLNCSRCPVGYYGDTCQYVITDCDDGREKNMVPQKTLLSYIQPIVTGPVLQVKCDFQSSFSWTAFQERYENCREIDFNRTWVEYLNGFGHAHSEYWLGLRNVYNIVNHFPTCRLSVRFSVGETLSVIYRNFSLSNEFDQFRIFATLGSINEPGDSLFNGTYSVIGRPFSTYDRDNTNFNCPNIFGSGWWFLDDPVCSRSNLNGRKNGESFESSIHWLDNLGNKTDFRRILLRVGKWT